ncbi:MAG: cyclic nucleotide-binding domain-containing protein [Deltaproteobacteria bacterium]|nr:cyclic nucleotide-binding domain-containing protein [Deltaproteobacteria bacterium]
MAKSALKGDVQFISVPEVLQLLGGNGATGELRLGTDTEEIGTIYVRDGNPIDATRGTKKGVEALYSLVASEKGGFEFLPKAVRRKDIVKKGRMEVILDALRMVDEGRPEASPAGGKPRDPASASDLPVIRGPMASYLYVVEHEEFSDGQRIVSEGKYGQWLWVILEGVVDITKETPKGPLTLLRLGEGAIIGNITGFSLEKSMRNSTASAVGNAHLGVLNYQLLSNEFALMSGEMKQFLISLDGRLRQLTDLAAQYYGNTIRPKAYVAGKTLLLKQNSLAKGLFKITQGEASVVRGKRKQILPLALLGPGDYYGRVPFLQIGHEPDGASVMASKDLRATQVDSNRFLEEYDGLSAMFKAMISHVANAISFLTDQAELYRAGGL